jgi:hypothetical protein
MKLTTGLFKKAFSNAVRKKGESLIWNEVMRKRDVMIGILKKTVVSLFLRYHRRISVLETPW